MPDSCYHCKIAESCGHYITNYTNRRHPDCPLVALPDKHGRLVDAGECAEYFWEHLDDNGMAGAMNAINEMPTIVEAEDEP